jgi:hypothetical protein
MQVNFKEIFNSLKSEIAILAKKTFADNVKEAKKDGLKILDILKTQLEAYTEEMYAGALTKEEFNDLVLGEKAELEMVALKRSGITLVEADKFKENVLKLIVETVFGSLKFKV